jgi:hypothetical protein
MVKSIKNRTESVILLLSESHENLLDIQSFISIEKMRRNIFLMTIHKNLVNNVLRLYGTVGICFIGVG